MKKQEREILRILEAFDATESVQSAAKLAGCDPKTVRRYVDARDAGRQVTAPSRRPRLIDTYAEQIEEWVDRSEGCIRADRVHERLVAMGFTGTERTTRRAVAEAKTRWWEGHRRTYRPWVAEAGLWLQFDWSQGPTVPGAGGTPRPTVLFCAWLPWSRYRIVIPCWDRSLLTLTCCLDTALRTVGGAPAYILTRGEDTPPADRGTETALRHPDVAAAGRHYGSQVRACAPYDPEPAAGTEGIVRLTTADLAPTGADLRPHYPSFAELRAACADFTRRSNARAHQGTGTSPDESLAAERTRLRPLPPAPHAPVLGERRTVSADRTVRHGTVRYPVPPGLVGREVWIRTVGAEVVIVADLSTLPHRPGRPTGLTEVARYRTTARTRETRKLCVSASGRN